MFGVEIDYRLDGILFKSAVIDIQYADDCVILAHTVKKRQTSLDLLTQVYQSLGLSINIRKKIILEALLILKYLGHPRNCCTFPVLRKSSIPEGHD